MDGSDVETLLSQAEGLEGQYEWLQAANSYDQALKHVLTSDLSKRGKIQERIGYTFFKVAMQADSVSQFIERVQRSTEEYEKANAIYRELGGDGQARMLRCDGMIAYLAYWIAPDASEKKRFLENSCRLMRKALNDFDKTGDALEYARTCTALSLAVAELFFLEWDFQVCERIADEAVECEERALTLLSSTDDIDEIARAYTRYSFFTAVYCNWFVSEIGEKEKYRDRSYDNWHKALELSEKSALLMLMSFSENQIMGNDEVLLYYDKAKNYAKETGDKFLIGNALDMLAYASFWKCLEFDEIGKMKEQAGIGLKHALDAKLCFSSISYVSPRGGAVWTEAPYVGYYYELSLLESDQVKKRELLEKSIIDGVNGVEVAKRTGYPSAIETVNHELSKALTSLAQIEPDREEKKILLEKALKYRKEALRISEHMERNFAWNRGIMWNYSADIKTELSTIEEDPKSKERILEEAISDKAHGLELLEDDLPYYVKVEHERSMFYLLGRSQVSFGQLLNRFYSLTHNRDILKRALATWKKAIESLQELSMTHRIAECYWKIAVGYDSLGEYLNASENFRMAAQNYESSTGKIPQLSEFYHDYALYLNSWAEIEKARDYHKRQEYGAAKTEYDAASLMQKASQRWSYLAPNYLAWAHIENGEDLSREEHNEEAIDAFKQASELFNETEKSLKTRLNSVVDNDEKGMVAGLIASTDLRHKYCLGRIAVEQARIFDKHGDHFTSSKEYGTADRLFEEVMQELDTDEGRQELRLIIALCQAWKMTEQAEAESSPKNYREASELFDKAREASFNEKTIMLTSGHSHLCRALEAGTKFTDTMDAASYSDAMHHLQGATEYYLKGDYQNFAEYARAIGLLLEANMYMVNARRESDPSMKSKLYAMAEKVLQASANAFNAAEHPEKRDRALQLLRNVKEDKELALSLDKILKGLSITSTTSALVTPTSASEKAVGIERFDHADIQTHLTVIQEVTVGEKLSLQLDLVNTGSDTALLMRLTDLFPKAFRVVEQPNQYVVENGVVELNGKRFEPLRVECVKMNLQAMDVGDFDLAPQVTYVDDLGTFRTQKTNPVTVSVQPVLTFKFKTESAQNIFDYLTSSFVEDYMRRRMTLEKSGFRTLTEIIKEGRASKSSVYGRSGHPGRALSELETRGLVESRIFTGERGRGGKILKVRVAYEKDIVRRQVDQRIMKKVEK